MAKHRNTLKKKLLKTGSSHKTVIRKKSTRSDKCSRSITLPQKHDVAQEDPAVACCFRKCQDKVFRGEGRNPHLQIEAQGNCQSPNSFLYKLYLIREVSSLEFFEKIKFIKKNQSFWFNEYNESELEKLLKGPGKC